MILGEEQTNTMINSSNNAKIAISKNNVKDPESLFLKTEGKHCFYCIFRLSKRLC